MSLLILFNSNSGSAENVLTDSAVLTFTASDVANVIYIINSNVVTINITVISLSEDININVGVVNFGFGVENIGRKEFMFSEGKYLDGYVYNYRIPNVIANRLRNEDIALTEFIKEQSSINQIENINIIDGFPNSAITMPSIAVEHGRTINDNIEITENRSQEIRYYKVSTYAHSEGARDDLVEFLRSLVDKDFYTLDNRQCNIYSSTIKEVSDVSRLPISKHKNYNFLRFDGLSTYIENAQYTYDLSNITVEVDVNIPSQSTSQYRSLLDVTSARKGLHIYIENNYLKVNVDTSQSTSFTAILNYSSYFNKRNKITIKYYNNKFSNIPLRYRHFCTIYINGTAVLGHYSILGGYVPQISSTVTVGSNNEYSNFLAMDLYGIRLSSILLSPQTGREKYTPKSGDLFLYTFDELIGSNVIDRKGLAIV